MRKNKKVIPFIILSAMTVASVTSVSGATNHKETTMVNKKGVVSVKNNAIDEEDSQNMAQQSGLQIVSVESVENGKVRLILNKSYPELTKEMISIICTTGGSDMTIQSIQPSDDYKTFDIITAYYDDNGYSLAIVFSDNSFIEKEFVSKYDCPQLTSVRTTRISDTEAKVNYISDEAGTFYYLIKEESTKTYSTKAVHKVPNELDGITEEDMLYIGTRVEMKSKANEFTIDNLNKGTAYTIYYMAASADGKTTLIKKISIDADVVTGDSSSINIEKAEGFYKYVSFLGENYRYEITLSEPTKEPLTLSNFKIACPSDGNMSLGRLETTDNQHYTIYMKVGTIPQGNNEFTVTVTFQDGTTAQKIFYVDFDAPLIYTTSSSIKRTKEKELEVTLKSNEEGSIYWTLLQPNDDFDPQSIANKDPKLIMDADPTKQILTSGTGTFTVTLDGVPPVGSYFCFVTQDKNGNTSDNFYYLAIPEYQSENPDNGGDNTQKTFEIISVTPSRHFTGSLVLSFKTEGNTAINQSGTKIEITLPSKNKKTYDMPHRYIDSSSSSLTIKDIFYASGEYTITITLPDGRIGTKSFTIS